MVTKLQRLKPKSTIAGTNVIFKLIYIWDLHIQQDYDHVHGS
jgi:hypothetical protein